MRTKVLHYFHTFHPDAQSELNRLAGEEARLTLEKARQGEGGKQLVLGQGHGRGDGVAELRRVAWSANRPTPRHRVSP